MLLLDVIHWFIHSSWNVWEHDKDILLVSFNEDKHIAQLIELFIELEDFKEILSSLLSLLLLISIELNNNW